MASYTLGLRNGQRLARKQEVKMPEVNPVKVVKEIKENKELEKEQDVLETILNNIDIYDGTEAGQKEIPD